jgi:pilus assembly protein CpaB
MKAARLVVLGVAVAAGGLAALLASGGGEKTPEPVKPTVNIETVDVLIAKGDINAGQAVSAQDFQWQAWPAATTSPIFIKKNDRPDAMEQLSGSISRAPFYAGEPIREEKLIKANGSGYLAAILPSGMRAVSTEISPETGAGGFILPGDRVDVIVTIRKDKDDKKKSKEEEAATSETVLNNVRVLAIDQTVEEKNGQKVVVGKTATLELTQRQAETLALSRQLGVLSLALRSLVDASGDRTAPIDEPKRTGVNTVRFGVSTMTNPK